MGRITLYGIPSSLVNTARGIFSGGVVDILWKTFVLTLFAVVIVVLIVGGGAVGAALGGILLGTLLSDDVRAVVANVWNRNWAEVNVP